MRRRFKLDVYNTIIIALLPSFLLVAAGATWSFERAEARRVCREASAYLDDVADVSASFQSGGTGSSARTWLASMEAIRPPLVARELHDASVASVNYAIGTNLNLVVSGQDAFSTEITPFRDSLDEGRDALVTACPDLAPNVSESFVMFFSEDDQ